jgi:hypothetical protein
MPASELFLDYLNGPDVALLALTDAEILHAVEAGLDAQGRGLTVIEPRMHLVPGAAFNGHFNVLRGYVGPLALAGVKIVGDYVDNYQRGLPSGTDRALKRLALIRAETAMEPMVPSLLLTPSLRKRACTMRLRRCSLRAPTRLP